ncbi:MAG: RNB domain-containing ribonuclease, partial [bacterium]
KTALSDRQKKDGNRNRSLQKVIIAILKEDSADTLSPQELFRLAGLQHSDRAAFRYTLQQMLHDGLLERRSKRRLALPQSPKIVTGILRLTRHGYGFIDISSDESVLIPAREARQAFNGDRIQIEVIEGRSSEEAAGRIISVDQKNRPKLLGRAIKDGSRWLVEAKTGGLTFQGRLLDSEINQTLHPSDWVILESPSGRASSFLPICKIQRVLGSPHQKGVAEEGLIAEYNLPWQHSPEIQQQAAVLKPTPTGSGIRRDLRSEFVITIDPSDAKDHDDAVSLQLDEQGNYRLGVHIADVSRYVLPGSSIDLEARQRGFSVYLQHHHLPMLPPILPGSLCSLKPGKDRLALSVLMKWNAQGELLDAEICPSKIRVNRLLSYETAQEFLNRTEGEDSKDAADRETAKHLRLMLELARQLKARRLASGGFDLDIPEPGFHWEDGAAPRGIYCQERLDSHILIEEFMLAANRAVAQIWCDRFGEKAPFVFRIHPPLDQQKRQKLADYLAEVGLYLSAGQLQSAQQLSGLFAQASEQYPPEVAALIMRKALTLAQYSPQVQRHFGLGFRRYCHFTSPIRRYADLIVHRLVWKYVVNRQPIEQDGDYGEQMADLCFHLNQRERLIESLEREAVKLAGLLYLNEKRNQNFKAVFVEAVKENLYVSLRDLFIEGALQESGNVFYQSQSRGRTKRSTRRIPITPITIGADLDVQIARIDLLTRNLEFMPA